MIRRVPLDFNWPLGMRWKGYVNPYCSQKCEECQETGYNRYTRRLYNSWHDWKRNLTQDEVDELVRNDRLPDGILTEDAANRWVKDVPFVFDAIDQVILAETRAKRQGVFGYCPICDGEGEVWFSDHIKQLYDGWGENERYDPPTGEGWQLWETISEGSPITPVFETEKELKAWVEKLSR